jgi:arginyl-tRNA--protein-N-Asp/Glu arginylyltransferase
VTSINDLRIYTTYPHPCSYIPGEEATTLFIDPQAKVDVGLYSQLSEVGFRRSGTHLYRPHCAACKACIPVRIPVDEFSHTTSSRRIMKRNADLEVRVVEDISGDTYFKLYADYICTRHFDGDMYPPTRQQYESFLTREWDSTRYYTFWRQDQLISVCVVDEMNNGLSAVYTFFDPFQDRHSLGNFGILWQIEECRRLGLPALYLGYWVKNCRKMSYKTRFRPLEMFVNGKWVKIL